MDTSPTLCLSRVGRVAVELQVRLPMLLQAMTTLRITPAASIDGIPFLDDEQQEQLRQWFNEREARA